MITRLTVAMPLSKKDKAVEIKASLESAFPDYEIVLTDSENDQFYPSLENSLVETFKDESGNDVTGTFVLPRAMQILSNF